MPSPYDIALARWARERNIPRPVSPEAMQVLKARFAADMQSRAAVQQQAIGAAQRTIDPTTAHDPRTILTSNGATTDLVDRVSPDELDDFHELVEQRNKALHQAGGDDLTRDVLLQGHAHAALTDAAAFARTNPPSVLKSVLGGSATVVLPPVGTSLQSIIASAPQVASWIGESDAETLPITITLGPLGQPTTRTSFMTLRAFGIIQFGTRATLMQAEVDVGMGSVLTVSGSQVTVALALDPPRPQASGGVVQNGSYQMSAMISFHPTQKFFPMTRTRFAENVAPGGVATVFIPAFARRFTIFINDFTSAPPGSDNSTKLTFFTADDTATGTISIPPSTPSQLVKLDRQTTNIGIANNSVSDTINYALVFELML